MFLFFRLELENHTLFAECQILIELLSLLFSLQDCKICFLRSLHHFHIALHFYGHFISKTANLDDNRIIASGPRVWYMPELNSINQYYIKISYAKITLTVLIFWVAHINVEGRRALFDYQNIDNNMF